jgi:hypothetical protein
MNCNKLFVVKFKAKILELFCEQQDRNWNQWNHISVDLSLKKKIYGRRKQLT